jgi:hypothetical protein
MKEWSWHDSCFLGEVKETEESPKGSPDAENAALVLGELE